MIVGRHSETGAVDVAADVADERENEQNLDHFGTEMTEKNDGMGVKREVQIWR